MRAAGEEELTAVPGIGKVLADAWITYFKEEKNNEMVDRLLSEVSFEGDMEVRGTESLKVWYLLLPVP
nr:helix-hairpin-helix domain-containing protein [Lacrimispora sphenoides]